MIIICGICGKEIRWYQGKTIYLKFVPPNYYYKETVHKKCIPKSKKRDDRDTNNVIYNG